MIFLSNYFTGDCEIVEWKTGLTHFLNDQTELNKMSKDLSLGQWNIWRSAEYIIDKIYLKISGVVVLLYYTYVVKKFSFLKK
jgi:hypothetical protein